MTSIKLSTYLVFALAVFASTSVQAAHVPALTADVLNFALNLECLEAQFYSCAAYGVPLSEELTAGGPKPTFCKKAMLTGPIALMAKDIADDEIAHVAFLRSVLGTGAVKCPKVNIGSAFSVAANAAFNTTLSPKFSPYANNLFFLHGAFIFEDVGVTAYKGAVPLLLSTEGKGYSTSGLYSAILENAAGILGTEAYHAGAVRSLLIEQAKVMTPYGVTVNQVIGAISTLRDTLDGKKDMDRGITANGHAVIAPADANAVPYSRTVGQVLRIVYGGSKPGLFFPDGLNGNVK